MKYYRCVKDNFMWKEGAILESSGSGYRPIEDLWNKVELGTEYISDHIIENPDNKDFFERVYKDSITGNIFRTKDQMVEMYKSAFKA